MHHQKLAQPPRFSSSKDMELLWEYNAKYLGYTDYDLTRAALGEAFYTSFLFLATLGNDIGPTISPGFWKTRNVPPKPHTILTQGFAKPSQDHLFHQEASF